MGLLDSILSTIAPPQGGLPPEMAQQLMRQQMLMSGLGMLGSAGQPGSNPIQGLLGGMQGFQQSYLQSLQNLMAQQRFQQETQANESRQRYYALSQKDLEGDIAHEAEQRAKAKTDEAEELETVKQELADLGVEPSVIEGLTTSKAAISYRDSVIDKRRLDMSTEEHDLAVKQGKQSLVKGGYDITSAKLRNLEQIDDLAAKRQDRINNALGESGKLDAYREGLMELGVPEWRANSFMNATSAGTYYDTVLQKKRLELAQDANTRAQNEEGRTQEIWDETKRGVKLTNDLKEAELNKRATGGGLTPNQVRLREQWLYDKKTQLLENWARFREVPPDVYFEIDPNNFKALDDLAATVVSVRLENAIKETGVDPSIGQSVGFSPQGIASNDEVPAKAKVELNMSQEDWDSMTPQQKANIKKALGI